MGACKACRDHRCHTKVEWRNHPLVGHGYTLETGWTHPEAKRLHYVEKEARLAIASGAAKPGTVPGVGGPPRRGIGGLTSYDDVHLLRTANASPKSPDDPPEGKQNV